jgi:DNA gyrase subunit B
MKPLIERGHVYIALPPLYGVHNGKEMVYAHTEEQLAQVLKAVKREKPVIKRYKGLSEMDPPELADTAMNPETRFIRRVTVEDAEKADGIFTMLMGDEVAERRDFIVKNARDVINLDSWA